VAAVPVGSDIPVVAKAGSSASDKIEMKLRMELERYVPTIALELRATDEVGNTRWAIRRLKVPR
jgi:hypothetical protein